MSKVLLFTASFGEGHNQAAFAVSEALQDAGATVKVVDYVEWLNPAFRSFAKFSLLQGVQKAPSLYGLFYKSMSRIQPDSSFQRRLNHLGLMRMIRLLRSFKPDVVVSTFPTPSGVMSELRTHGLTTTPNVGIITDYTLHGQWIQEHTDAYFVAAESVKQELLARGVPSSHVFVSGIPIRSKFTNRSNGDLVVQRQEARQRHEFKTDVPLILLMGGGAGLLGDVNDWERLMKKTNAQFAVICGRNERLYKRLQSIEDERIRILGYVSDVDEWMVMADLIITKAGGITVSECMAMELPMLLYRPIPGQETANAKYAIEAGAAVQAKTFRMVKELINTLTHQPERLETMRRNAHHVKRANATTDIATTILEIAKRPGRRKVSSRSKRDDKPTSPIVSRP
ncbi:MGDG synthase family glycosyltransferase [Alicyclobacillus mengziensis]|uniref:Glycosyltransferase n=1 Tax=Alicyclobacillus mengziensis TaxID=2931921 RepID=A0A9X7VZR2_9BACL|nr:glycosyltransferase [Alicyclobacillus mengziensis]QSO48058.1 glycosyltransferase [Alicyclobacillus mengziensis]